MAAAAINTRRGSSRVGRFIGKAPLLVVLFVLMVFMFQSRQTNVLLSYKEDNSTMSGAATDAGIDSKEAAAKDKGSNNAIETTPTGLRFDWTNIPVRSPIAKRLHAQQQNCSIPVKHYKWREFGVGMGSDLHAWGNALWAGLNDGHRIHSPTPWLWIDYEACGNSSLFQCYFPHAEPECLNEITSRGRIAIGPCGKKSTWKYNYTIPDYRAAATEYAFSSLSPMIVKEAQEMRHSLFGDSPTPSNLVTVHVRWGDNKLEVSRNNNPIAKYIEAIETMVRENKMQNDVHILLCTEDPLAVDAFQQATFTKNWTIHLDPFYDKYLPYRKNREIKYNLASHISTETNGKAGRWALASLLVAMEANFYVLTTMSNWSRLMNELRKNVVNPSCGNCTKLIDIDEGEC